MLSNFDRLGIKIPETAVISLGQRFDVAWQVRNYFGQSVSYPFDWLVTPLQSIPYMIETEFEDIAEPGCLERIDYTRGETIWHRAYDVFLHHEFPRDSHSRIRNDWPEYIARMQLKWMHLRRRWQLTLENARTIILVRSGGCLALPEERSLPTTSDDYEVVREVIQRRAPQAAVFMLVVGADDLTQWPDFVFPFSIDATTEYDWPNPIDRWKGPTSEYIRCFDYTCDLLRLHPRGIAA